MALPKPSTTSTALVTGASSGIGAAIARKLAKRGYGVTLVARREDLLQTLATELENEYGVRADVIPCDLADPADRDALVSKLKGNGLDVDILVNNAGFATGGRYNESDPAREVQQARVLVEAVVALTSAFLPDMVNRRRGAILNVASTAGMQPLPYSAGYSAAKAHTVTFSEAIHMEVAGAGVTVTALCPGPVKTDFWGEHGEQPMEKALPKRIWLDSDAVAEAGIRGLERGRRVVVPGLRVRSAAYSSQYVPNFVKLRVLANRMKPAR